MYENIYGVGRKTELLSTVWSYIVVTSHGCFTLQQGHVSL